MELVTDEISTACKVLGLSVSQCRRLPDDDTELLYQDLLESFVEGGDRRWWWEAFRDNTTSIEFSDDKGFEHIIEFVPNPSETIWFVVEEDQLPFYPIYETTPEHVVKIIGECYAFEYYLVSKSKEWILCENHHRRVIGVGEQVTNRLAQYISQRK